MSSTSSSRSSANLQFYDKNLEHEEDNACKTLSSTKGSSNSLQLSSSDFPDGWEQVAARRPHYKAGAKNKQRYHNNNRQRNANYTNRKSSFRSGSTRENNNSSNYTTTIVTPPATETRMQQYNNKSSSRQRGHHHQQHGHQQQHQHGHREQQHGHHQQQHGHREQHGYPHHPPQQQHHHGHSNQYQQYSGERSFFRSRGGESKIAQTIIYAVEFIGQFFNADPFISVEEVSRFNVKLANDLYKHITSEQKKFLFQRTQPDPNRTCCQRSDEFLLELNVGNRLNTFIVDASKDCLVLTEEETADLLPNNTLLVISESYVLYVSDDGARVVIYRSSECKLAGRSVKPCRRSTLCFDQNLRRFEDKMEDFNKYTPLWNPEASLTKFQVFITDSDIDSSDEKTLPRSQSEQTITLYNKQHGNEYAQMTPPHSAPPFKVDKNNQDGNTDFKKSFFDLVKSLKENIISCSRKDDEPKKEE